MPAVRGHHAKAVIESSIETVNASALIVGRIVDTISPTTKQRVCHATQSILL
jgi:hypothetical protein